MLPRLAPLPPGRTREPFDHADWLFELKYDGFRAHLYLDRGEARLMSRNGNVMKRFDALAVELAQDIRLRSAILDGEIVCLGDDGRPQFDRLFYRGGTPSFVVFDLLWMNGRDYRERPLLFRKATLATVIGQASTCVLNAQYVLERGVDLYRTVCERDLEGIVAKRSQSLYAELGNKSPWVKIKNPAYSQGEGRREMFERVR